jgi:hypothetical protein
VSVDLWQWIENFASKSAPNFLVALAALVVGLVALPLIALQTLGAFRPAGAPPHPAAPPVSDALVKLLQALFPGALWELAQALQRTSWGPSLVQRLPRRTTEHAARRLVPPARRARPGQEGSRP